MDKDLINTFENTKSIIKDLYKKVETAPKSQLREIKKKIKDNEKILYKYERKIYAECTKEGHDFGQWFDQTWSEEVEYRMPYSLDRPTITVNHPTFTRKCSICGMTEETHYRPSSLEKLSKEQEIEMLQERIKFLQKK